MALLTGEDFGNRVEIVESLRKAYKTAFANTEASPWERYSAAVGLAEHAADDNTYELVFKRADASMYDDKRAFKQQCGSYR